MRGQSKESAGLGTAAIFLGTIAVGIALIMFKGISINGVFVSVGNDGPPDIWKMMGLGAAIGGLSILLGVVGMRRRAKIIAGSGLLCAILGLGVLVWFILAPLYNAQDLVK